MRPWRKRKVWQFRLAIGWAFYCTWLWRNSMDATRALIGFPLVFALTWMMFEVMLFDALDEGELWDSFELLITFQKIGLPSNLKGNSN
jgi:hypothetical protein